MLVGNEAKICPLLGIHREHYRFCEGEKCALWNEKEKRCGLIK